VPLISDLLKYATERDADLLKHIIEHGNQRAAERATGINRNTLQGALQRTQRAAIKQGYSPAHDMTRTVPAGFHVKGVSTYYDEDGKPRGQWVKSARDKEEQAAALRDFVEGLKADIKPAKPRPDRRKQYASDLMPSIFIGDAHVGMYAHGDETKHADFDSNIATAQIRDAIDYLVDKAEPAENGLLVDVGDFMHANGSQDTTFSGTKLDVDTRHYSVMRKAAMVMRYSIDAMLRKMKNVTVIIARGNHNTDAAVAVQLMLEFYYEREPRVNILPTEGFYHYLEYGNWLIGVTHGDKQKPESLAGAMARDMAQAWGRTTHRLWATGHFHKEAVKTLPGVKHKVFAALPPPDSWHASHGYAGDGEMEMMTFRKSGGVHSSFVYNIPQPRTEPDVRIG
jgi:hypothetical protein